MKREFLIVRSALANGLVHVDGPWEPLGSQQDVRAVLQTTFGDGIWQSFDQGVFDSPTCSLLAKLSIFDVVDTMMVETWGSGDPVLAVEALCRAGNWQAFDADSWEVVVGSPS